jgi:ATP-dependent DNA helicase DinG
MLQKHMSSPQPQSAPLLFPTVAVIVASGSDIAVMSDKGEIITQRFTDRLDIGKMIGDAPVLCCHAPWTAQKAGLERWPAFDLLELFAFVRAGEFVTPTPFGIAKALGIVAPQDADDMPFFMIELCQILLSELQSFDPKTKHQCASIATAMARQGHGWAWAPYVLGALGVTYDENAPTNPKKDMNIFEDMPEWAEEAPPPPNKFDMIGGDETRAHLETLLKRRTHAGRQAELRAQQQNYATRMANMFAPKTVDDSPHMMIAQAGTGIGKTYGYLAPAQLWAQKNEGRVTVSTYTKNLQRQIEQDLDILYPDAGEKSRKAVTQKGRENYLCLLNLQDFIAGSALAQDPRMIIAAGLMARWAMESDDGDLSGNSFPGWLGGLLGIKNTLGLADRRGECVYAACDHYHKCFIEKMNRKAQRAEIVINNHALTMIRAATEASDAITPFVVFDEAHHVFTAADSAFGANLTGLECADLRRWIVGPEDENRQSRGVSRGRGLRKRLEGVVGDDSPASYDVAKILVAAKEALPAPGWRKRVFKNDPFGAVEDFLSSVAAHVRTRAKDGQSPYSIECDVHPVSDVLIEKAEKAHKALKKIRVPMTDLAANLRAMVEDDDGKLDKDILTRLDSLSFSIERRVTNMLAAWMGMLENIMQIPDEPSSFIDWFEIDRIDGRDYDCGYLRRYKNPMEPLGNALRHQTHGIVMTSATLKSGSGDWDNSLHNLGVNHMTDMTPEIVDLPSPFRYAEQSKVMIVTDVDKGNAIAVANAYKSLFEASKGGALGLFTSIRRLKQVNHAIIDAMARQSIPLYAQHCDDIDIGTLIDMFRDNNNACLLGTDAIRDGIDVTGSSLRLMVYDRVPWPRPTILHRERRTIFGGKAYDDHETRLRIKQAYGRLIRSDSDKGVFVMLDGAMPTRLIDAFPEGVEIQRLTLKEAIKKVKDFL